MGYLADLLEEEAEELVAQGRKRHAVHQMRPCEHAPDGITNEFGLHPLDIVPLDFSSFLRLVENRPTGKGKSESAKVCEEYFFYIEKPLIIRYIFNAGNHWRTLGPRLKLTI